MLPVVVLGWEVFGWMVPEPIEGFNNKAKLTTRKAYGFRTYRAIEIVLYHALGNLPIPKAAHKFF